MVDPGAARPATSDERRALGGYDPEAGRNPHQAGAPTLIPVPSLLRSLLSDHLDPGYAAAAASAAPARNPGAGWPPRAGRCSPPSRSRRCSHSPSHRRRPPRPACGRPSRCWRAACGPPKPATDSATARRDALAAELDTERRSRLEGDERGRRLLGSLDGANFSAAATAVTGPGLTVTVTDPGVSKDLSDVSKERVEGSRQVILDRDLQLVVNSLWASGAEAVSVGGVRIGPNVTIRQAGGGILVDNQPISSPYAILAVGPPHGMADAFDRSPGLQRLRLLEASYGVVVTVSSTDD